MRTRRNNDEILYPIVLEEFKLEGNADCQQRVKHAVHKRARSGSREGLSSGTDVLSISQRPPYTDSHAYLHPLSHAP